VLVAIGALLGLAAIVLVVAAFVELERRNLSHVPAAIALGFLVFESVLLPAQAQVPSGLFRFGAAGQDIRITVLPAILAVVARVWVRGFPRRVSTTGLLWTAYLTWYGLGAVIGHVRGHPNDVIIFEFRSVIMIAAGYLLFAGTPIHAFMGRRAVGAWTAVLAVAIAIVSTTTLFDLYTELSLGVQRFPGFGSYGPSGRSVVAAMAVVLVVTEGCRSRPRSWILTCGVLLLVSPIVGVQRASMVQAAVSFVLLGIVVFGSTWRARAEVTPTVSGLVVLGLVGLVIFVIVLPPAVTGEPSAVVANLDRAFSGEGQQGSVDARQRLWSETRDLIEEHPVFGWGLGQRSELTRPFPLEPVEVSSHNILLDVMIRTGVIGLVLFALAVGASLLDALRAWRTSPDVMAGAFGVACAIALVGLIAKGLVESIFENFRLALLFGMLVGGIAAAARSTPPGDARVYDDDPERTGVQVV
jgi:O-antigen ligase